MRAPIVDISTGSAPVDGSPTLLLAPINLADKVGSFTLWAINRGPKPILVYFHSGQAADALDIDTLQASDPVGTNQQASLHRERDNRRFWSILAACPTYSPGDVCTVEYGVSIDRNAR